MQKAITKGIIQQEDEMREIRLKFIEADYKKLGYLTLEQVMGIMRGLDV